VTRTIDDRLYDYVWGHSDDEILLVLETALAKPAAGELPYRGNLQECRAEKEAQVRARLYGQELAGRTAACHDPHIEHAFDEMYRHFAEKREDEWRLEDREFLARSAWPRLPELSSRTRRTLAILLPNKIIAIAAYLAIIHGADRAERTEETRPAAVVERRYALPTMTAHPFSHEGGPSAPYHPPAERRMDPCLPASRQHKL
jgi:hypothetical protein